MKNARISRGTMVDRIIPENVLVSTEDLVSFVLGYALVLKRGIDVEYTPDFDRVFNAIREVLERRIWEIDRRLDLISVMLAAGYILSSREEKYVEDAVDIFLEFRERLPQQIPIKDPETLILSALLTIAHVLLNPRKGLVKETLESVRSHMEKLKGEIGDEKDLISACIMGTFVLRNKELECGETSATHRIRNEIDRIEDFRSALLAVIFAFGHISRMKETISLDEYVYLYKEYLNIIEGQSVLNGSSGWLPLLAALFATLIAGSEDSISHEHVVRQFNELRAQMKEFLYKNECIDRRDLIR